MVLGMMGCGEEQSNTFRNKFRADHGDINCAVLLKAAHEAGIPRKTHCDGLVFEVVEALDAL